MTLKLMKLDRNDEQLRADIILAATDLIRAEKIDIPTYTNDDVLDFVLEWYDLSGRISVLARKEFSRVVVNGETTLDWIRGEYSISRLEICYRFSSYCDWLDPKEIIQHWGDLVKVFLAVQGSTPSWWKGVVPYHCLLQNAYTYLYRSYRVKIICVWLQAHWEEAVNYFEYNTGILSFPYPWGVEEYHVYTQYRRLCRREGMLK